ncbi:MAG: hypothetical protein WBV77_10510 [Solirubrobacteraceae bacterium]
MSHRRADRPAGDRQEPSVTEVIQLVVYYWDISDWEMLEMSAWLLWSLADRELRRSREKHA